ncbi:hypothetical protein GN244_ATG17601 [Phytophthora infestans]|nr:hypothetical protein GN244_ATG17601 [Phytophthora infestans]
MRANTGDAVASKLDSLLKVMKQYLKMKVTKMVAGEKRAESELSTSFVASLKGSWFADGSESDEVATGDQEDEVDEYEAVV